MNNTPSFYNLIEQFKSKPSIAVYFKDQCLPYCELYRQILIISNYLKSNFSVAHSIAIKSSSTLDHVIISLSILYSGFRLIEVPDYFAEHEFHTFIEEVHPDLLIPESCKPDIQNEHSITILSITELIKESKNFSYENGNCSINYTAAPDIVFYTSGSTGVAKGIVKEETALLACINNRISTFGLNSNSVTLINEDLSYTMGLLHLYASLFSGATAILITYDKDLYKNIHLALSTYPVSHIYANPNLLFNVLTNKHIDAIKFTDLEFIAVTGDLVSNKLRALVHEKTGRYLNTVYAQSETGLIFISQDKYQTTNGIMGQLCNNQISYQILDDNGNIIDKPLQHGELVLKSPSMFSAYLKNPELNMKAFTAKGFYYTGDIVYYGEDKQLYFVGRKNFMLTLPDGNNVSPFEVEEALLQTGLIIAAVVSGDRTIINGVKINAVIVLNDNISMAEFKKVIPGILSKRLSYYKHPQCYFITDRLKYTSRDKIDRKYYNNPTSYMHLPRIDITRT